MLKYKYMYHYIYLQSHLAEKIGTMPFRDLYHPSLEDSAPYPQCLENSAPYPPVFTQKNVLLIAKLLM